MRYRQLNQADSEPLEMRNWASLLLVVVLLTSTFIGCSQDSEGPLDAILDEIRHHDGLLKSFDADFVAKQEFPEALPYQKFPNRNILQDINGHARWMGDRFYIQSFIETTVEHATPRNNNTNKWNREDLESFDGEFYRSVNVSEKRARITRKVVNLSLNATDMGITIGASNQYARSLTELEGVDWRYIGREEIRGVWTERIDGIRPDGNLERLWVDPDRGYRAIRFEREILPENFPLIAPNTEFGRHEFFEFEEFPGGVWIPTESVVTIFAIEPDGTEHIYAKQEFALEVHEVNVEYSTEDFRVEIPAGFRVDDETKK